MSEYRDLEQGEVLLEGDQALLENDPDDTWTTTCFPGKRVGIDRETIGCIYRRRISGAQESDLAEGGE